MTLLAKLRRLVTRRRGKRSPQPCLFPSGHFYSPIADLEDIGKRQATIWAKRENMPGIDWNAEAQLLLLKKALSSCVDEIKFPADPPEDKSQYFCRNDQFPLLDAEVLSRLLIHFKPKRMIEVGSGFSSLVTAQINRDFLNGTLNFTCIEPYPRQFLLDGLDGISELYIRKVEDVSPDYFKCLMENDILFIDSSHVSKVASDVNHLIFEVIPRLNRGVLIHIHDIFLPDEYPKRWILEEGRNWNEQYLVRAFLQFNSHFEVIWASHFMATRHTEEVTKVFPQFPAFGSGGSLWLRRI